MISGLKKSPLQTAYIIFGFAMLSAYWYKDDFPGDIEYLSVGIYGHLVFLLFSLLGFVVGKVLFGNKINNQKNNTHCKPGRGKLLMPLALILLFVGVIASYKTASFFGGALSYYESISSVGRSNFELSAEEGGAPGIFKLLSHTSNGVFAALCIIYVGLIEGGDHKSVFGRHILFGVILSIFALAFKVSVSLDRATILLMIIGVAYIFLRRKTSVSSQLSILIFGFWILSFVSSFRLADHGILDFIGLYATLGLENFGRLLSQKICFDFGANTIFSALSALTGKLLGVGISGSCLGENWTYNPAQYFFRMFFLIFLT